ncbi:MAG: NHLP leader peptide family RiPP precursor [bacterium]
MEKSNKRKQFDQEIIEKAMKDGDFRKRLLENPSAVIENELGIPVPGKVNVKILEEDAQTVYLVLPHLPAQSDEIELTETEIEAVSGGGHTVVIQLCGSFDCTTTTAG